jgi:hypothetical protein
MNSDPARRPAARRWVKSSHSGPTGGNCVEIASLGSRRVAVRDSRIPDGPMLIFTVQQWQDFASGTKNGISDLRDRSDIRVPRRRVPALH